MAKIQITILKRLDLIFVWPVLLYRWCAFGYTFRRIYLGEGFWTILEPADYYRLRQFKWILNGNGHNLYAIRHKIVGPNKTWTISMHREIMRPTDDRLVDHRNCDSLDNRRANLRFATHAENIHNRRKRKNATSQYIGVFFRKDTRKWVGKIMDGKKQIILGNFDNEIDAARAYDAAAKKYHGEFARLNFPPASEESKALFARIGRLISQIMGPLRGLRFAFMLDPQLIRNRIKRRNGIPLRFTLGASQAGR